MPGASLVTAVVVIVLSLMWKARLHAAEPTTGNDNDDAFRVPFVVVGEPSWPDLTRAMDHYHQDVSRILHGLSKSLEVTIMSEWELWGMEDIRNSMQDRLKQQITRLSLVLDEDAAVLENVLLQPFPSVAKVIAGQPHFEHCSSQEGADCHEETFLPRYTRAPKDAASSYDSAAHVVTHMVRDWTALGREVRKSTYEWCRTQLLLHCKDSTHPVLVPGAGLGRLAFELSTEGHHVEANEFSLVMAAAAHAVLSGSITNGTLHPFAMDYFVNEVDSEQRYEAVPFPDLHGSKDKYNRRGTLSYTVGDFVELYSSLYAQNVYGAVVTCFFIDTATNIYEYLVTISNLLKDGGVWINVGPVQWHPNALVRPSVSDLFQIVEAMGFNILSWRVDDKPVNYRHDEHAGDPVRSTKYEAYRPLRFVAVRQSGSSSSTPMSAPASAVINNLRTQGKSIAAATAFGSNPNSQNKAQHVSVSSSTVVIEELDEES